MRFSRNQKMPSIDIDHMKALHEECVEQLELMQTSLEAAQLASYLMRDKLDAIAVYHWHSYIEMLHLLCMHDALLHASIQKIGLDITRGDAAAEQQHHAKRLLILGLLRTLIRRHQRFIYMYKATGEPTKDYLNDSGSLEREYTASIIEMIHHTL